MRSGEVALGCPDKCSHVIREHYPVTPQLVVLVAAGVAAVAAVAAVAEAAMVAMMKVSILVLMQDLGECRRTIASAGRCKEN